MGNKKAPGYFTQKQQLIYQLILRKLAPVKSTEFAKDKNSCRWYWSLLVWHLWFCLDNKLIIKNIGFIYIIINNVLFYKKN